MLFDFFFALGGNDLVQLMAGPVYWFADIVIAIVGRDSLLHGLLDFLWS